MEKFCQHIEKLLAHHDYVVVPNLGGFVVQIQTAQILSDRITPPLATIAFNPLMHHADGLLAIEIARSEQISYRMAMEYIEKEIESIKHRLKSDGSIRFGNIGTFLQNESGTLTFSPFETTDFLPHNFQLTDLHISNREFRHIEERRISIKLPSRSLFKYAAVAMIVFGLFAVTPKISDTKQTNNAGFITALHSDKIQSNLSVKSAIAANTADTVTAINDTVVKVSGTTSDISTSFHVIVASSATKESADRYCKELATNNFPNAQVLPPSKTYRVAVQSFTNRDEAIKYMENLRKTDSRFETAWVLCN